MNLEKQVTSLELSKKLKELGIKQHSIFWWNQNEICCSEPSENYNGEYWSAFTTAELLDLLPHNITTKVNEPFDNYRLLIKTSFIVKNPEHINPIKTYIVNYKCDTIDMTSK